MGMGVDRELVRAFGYLAIGVIAVSAGVSALIAFGTDNFDAIWLFLPLLVGYSVFLGLLSIGLALYVFVRSKADRVH
jgi:fatty acid desaturase